jgi:dihydrofolate reductase
MGRVLGVGMSKGGSLLLGRFTYEAFYAYWPHQTDNPYTEVLNNSQKFVASRTLGEPLPWMNSTLLHGDAADAVATLKDERDEDIVILGSGELIRSLMARDLIDEYLLMVHPLVLGAGRRLFPDAGPPADLRLAEAITTTKGVVIARYQSG